MELARQCADESRHVLALIRRLKQLGGFKGEFPIANFEWCITNLCDTLEARLAIQNRTFEAGQMDLLGALRKVWRSVNDERTAEMLEHILADEVNHVRFANRWIRRLAQENPRVLLKVAVAMRMFSEVNAALAIKEGDTNIVGVDLGFKQQNNIGINVDDRRQADFSEDEIDEIASVGNEFNRSGEEIRMTSHSETEFDESLFAPGPARDDRFKVVNRWIEVRSIPMATQERDWNFFHRQMNEEINGMENAARSLVDFPNADWNIRMSIARQCADEARHVMAFKRTFGDARGG